MGYREIYAEENEEVKERLELVIERICEIGKETILEEKYQDYFSKTAEFIQDTYQIFHGTLFCLQLFLSDIQRFNLIL